MAKTLAVTLAASITGAYATTSDLHDASSAISIKQSLALASGVGLDQSDLTWSDTRTMGGAPDDIDLTAVTAVDIFGATLTFVKIKCIFVAAALANAAVIAVGGDANGLVGWVASNSDIVNVAPGGFMMFAAPSLAAYAVTATTADILQINGTNGDIYDITLIGTSA